MIRQAIDLVAAVLLAVCLFFISAAVLGLWLGLALRFVWVLA